MRIYNYCFTVYDNFDVLIWTIWVEWSWRHYYKSFYISSVTHLGVAPVFFLGFATGPGVVGSLFSCLLPWISWDVVELGCCLPLLVSEGLWVLIRKTTKKKKNHIKSTSVMMIFPFLFNCVFITFDKTITIIDRIYSNQIKNKICYLLQFCSPLMRR